jgi:hypothetical protein
MDWDRYQSLQRQLAKHRSNLNYLEEQAAPFGSGNAPLSLHNQIVAEQTAIESIHQALATYEGQLDVDNLAPTDTYGAGQNWRQTTALLTDVTTRSVSGYSTPDQLAVALSWLDTLETRLRDWYQDYLEKLYLDDFFALDPGDAEFAAGLARLERRYKAFHRTLWDKARKAGVCDNLHQLANRFDADFRPIIAPAFNADEIRDRFVNTLGQEQEVVHETWQFLDLLLQDIRKMRQTLKEGDQAGLHAAQQTGCERIAALRRKVNDTLDQLSGARAALRAALVPIGPTPSATV